MIGERENEEEYVPHSSKGSSEKAEVYRDACLCGRVPFIWKEAFAFSESEGQEKKRVVLLANVCIERQTWEIRTQIET